MKPIKTFVTKIFFFENYYEAYKDIFRLKNNYSQLNRF